MGNISIADKATLDLVASDVSTNKGILENATYGLSAINDTLTDSTYGLSAIKTAIDNSGGGGGWSVCETVQQRELNVSSWTSYTFTKPSDSSYKFFEAIAIAGGSMSSSKVLYSYFKIPPFTSPEAWSSGNYLGTSCEVYLTGTSNAMVPYMYKKVFTDSITVYPNHVYNGGNLYLVILGYK